jgi:regulatory protein
MNNGPRKSPLTLRERALRLLAQRERSRLELRRKLLTRGTEPQKVDALLEEFAQAGWLSDARFADARVRTRAGTVSRRYISQELKQHGVDTEVAADAIAQLDQDDYHTALALWRRKFGTTPRDDKEKARQVRWLQARGFPLSVIFKLLRAQGVASDEE